MWEYCFLVQKKMDRMSHLILCQLRLSHGCQPSQMSRTVPDCCPPPLSYVDLSPAGPFSVWDCKYGKTTCIYITGFWWYLLYNYLKQRKGRYWCLVDWWYKKVSLGNCIHTVRVLPCYLGCRCVLCVSVCVYRGRGSVGSTLSVSEVVLKNLATMLLQSRANTSMCCSSPPASTCLTYAEPISRSYKSYDF